MQVRWQLGWWVVLATLGTPCAQVQYPILPIPAGQPLPILNTSRDHVLLNMVPNEIRVSAQEI